jgi:hypothetical protein
VRNISPSLKNLKPDIPSHEWESCPDQFSTKRIAHQCLFNVGINGSPAVDGGAPASLSPSTSKESLENTQPQPFETARSNIDPPMNLLEIHVAAEHALLNSITDETLRKSLTSVENFEVLFAVAAPDISFDVPTIWCTI